VFDATPAWNCAPSARKARGRASSSVPNGIAVQGDYLFVVERDNHRVQLLSLPDFKTIGTFGEKELRSPYGIWLTEKEPGELDVYITDSFMYGKKFDVVPPFDELNQRVRRYRVVFDQDGACVPSTRAPSAIPMKKARCAWSNPSLAIRRTIACWSPTRTAAISRRCANTPSAAATPAAACRRMLRRRSRGRGAMDLPGWQRLLDRRRPTRAAHDLPFSSTA
jgi:hypothetical protein